jgi:quercetin dioxygenase-like cupin family protein
MNQSSIPQVIQPGDGVVHEALGDRLAFKLTGEQTGNAFSLFECTVPPGGGPPIHFHLHEDELFIVKQGQLNFYLEGRWIELGVDGIAFAPRGRVHTYRNNTDQPCRCWVLTTPSGFESFFGRLARECARHSPPDLKQIDCICAQHGIHLVPQTGATSVS